jgi:hypothetical protein
MLYEAHKQGLIMRLRTPVLLLALLITLLAPFAGTALAGDPEDVLALVNQHRANNGLAPVCLSGLLSQAAYNHSQDMQTNNYFDHTGLNGSMPWDRIEAVGYRGSYFSENIAMGYSPAVEVVTGWINSPSHNANLLSSKATEMGLARVGDYWTQTFSNGQTCSSGQPQPVVDTEPVVVDNPNVDGDSSIEQPTPPPQVVEAPPPAPEQPIPVIDQPAPVDEQPITPIEEEWVWEWDEGDYSEPTWEEGEWQVEYETTWTCYCYYDEWGNLITECYEG